MNKVVLLHIACKLVERARDSKYGEDAVAARALKHMHLQKEDLGDFGAHMRRVHGELSVTDHCLLLIIYIYSSDAAFRILDLVLQLQQLLEQVHLILVRFYCLHGLLPLQLL